MSRVAKKEKWTLVFDAELKNLVIKAAKRMGTDPASILENLVRTNLNPFGHADVRNSAAYVAAFRKGDRWKSDRDFLMELRTWQKSHS